MLTKMNGTKTSTRMTCNSMSFIQRPCSLRICWRSHGCRSTAGG